MHFQSFSKPYLNNNTLPFQFDQIRQHKLIRFDKMSGEILVIPFIGQGHLFPCVELCKHFAARDFNATLIIPSKLSSSIAPSARQNPNIEILDYQDDGRQPVAPGIDFKRSIEDSHRKMGLEIEGLLAERFKRSSTKPVCAVIDTMMCSTREVFWKFGIPTVTFLTSGASNAAVELCVWKSGLKESEIKPGQTLKLPGLPDEMAFSFSELKRSSRPPPGFHGAPPGPPPAFGAGGMPGFGGGPPGGRKPGPGRLGDEPRWMEEVEGSVGLLVNSCDELEGQFLKYLSSNMNFPVWGVGPLLPEDYWKPFGTLVRDGKLRASKKSNYTEDEVVEWMASKPQGSVLYVSFGSEVSPSNEEFDQLAKALEESDQPFIWVLQLKSASHGPPPPLHPGATDARTDEAYFPSELAAKAGKRGLIIKGWAPQLMILSHPSTGGFLSHCGWNSTVEAIGRGIPILAWPIRGDQFSDAKLVVSVLKTGYMVTDDFSESVEKEHIAKGIELLMSDQDMKKRAEAIAAEFGKGFPPSSVAALDAFRNFITSPK